MIGIAVIQTNLNHFCMAKIGKMLRKSNLLTYFVAQMKIL